MEAECPGDDADAYFVGIVGAADGAGGGQLETVAYAVPVFQEGVEQDAVGFGIAGEEADTI